jgi:hypothetical protein
VQQAPPVSAPRVRVGRIGTRARRLGTQQHDGVQPGIAPPDAIEVLLEQGARIHDARANTAGEFGGSGEGAGWGHANPMTGHEP